MNEENPLEVARDLSQLLLAAADLSREVFAEIARDLDVSVQHARALCLLDGTAPMAELATKLACDKSYVTVLTDQMEGLDLVKRILGIDRRFKLLELTPKGTALRQELEYRIALQSPVMVSLSALERGALERLLAKILPERPRPLATPE